MPKLLLLIGIAAALSSCSIWPYKSDFDCRIPVGEKCKSLYEINKKADDGRYDPENYHIEDVCQDKKGCR